jgi:hypothetical protein
MGAISDTVTSRYARLLEGRERLSDMVALLVIATCIVAGLIVHQLYHRSAP